MPTASSQSTAVGVCKATLNILVLVLFAQQALASYQLFATTRSVRVFGAVVVGTLFLALFVLRRPAKEETPSLSLWLLATAGAALPMLMRPSSGSPYLEIGYAVQVCGFAMLTAALLSLRRSFAVVPGNRGVREGGLYRIIRHPVYVAELTTLFGVVLANPTLANVLIWLCECGVQYVRARAEEDFLSSDPVYRAYRERVRYRLIPGVL